jgi:hypothetical protein
MTAVHGSHIRTNRGQGGQSLRATAWVICGLLASFIGLSAANAHGDHPKKDSAKENKELCTGFVPENDLRIPVGQRHRMRVQAPWLRAATPAPGGITEADFNEIIDRAEKIYAPEIAAKGAKLQFNRLWTDATVNASAMQYGSTWVVNMYGGLARHPATSREGFAVVVCHELGHHIGGAPKYSGWFGDDWATNEGGADYFATLKCMRRLFADDDNEAIISRATLDPFAQARCESQFTDRAQQLLCLRSVLGGQSVALLFMDLRKETTPPRFDITDPKVVTRTDDNHPATQCRMDTYFAGAICPVDQNVAVSDRDYRAGSCIQGVDTLGWRPRCWFKPN